MKEENASIGYLVYYSLFILFSLKSEPFLFLNELGGVGQQAAASCIERFDSVKTSNSRTLTKKSTLKRFYSPLFIQITGEADTEVANIW